MTHPTSQGRLSGLSAMCLLLAIYLAWFLIPPLWQGATPGEGSGTEGLAGMASTLWPEVILAGSILAFAVFDGDWRGLHATTPLNRHWWLWLIPVVLYLGFVGSVGMIMMAAAGEAAFAPEITQILLVVVLTTFLVGIFEEFLFRGFVYRALDRWKGPIVAFFLSSILFGSMHYVNWVGGQSLGQTHNQVLHAAGAGLLYAGLMLKCGSIWVPVLVHGAWDAVVSFNQTMGGLVAAAAPTEEATPAIEAPTAEAGAAVAADPGLLGALIQGLVTGYEPLYGLLLFILWYRSRRSASAVA